MSDFAQDLVLKRIRRRLRYLILSGHDAEGLDDFERFMVHCVRYYYELD